MGLGSTVKAIWTLLQGTTNPDVVALYNNLYHRLEGARMNARQGKGNIYFVNGGADGVTAGLDTNNGLTPATPFLTIAHAISQCVDRNDDFIYCWNTYNQDTFPITLTLSKVHIIGIASPNGQMPALEGQGDNAAAFTFGIGVEGCEIAGFNMSAGAAHACIEFVGGNNQTWIHNCTFGHYWFGGGQDGILFAASNVGVIIEDNWFYGEKGPVGKLTRYGIVNLTGSLYQSTIRNNTFVMVNDGAIWMGGTNGEVDIVHNLIALGQDDQAGRAILLGPACTGFLVAQNEAGFGPTAFVTFAPYHDMAGGTANHWMSNQAQDQWVFADEVPS
jgi:hypothetical protein